MFGSSTEQSLLGLLNFECHYKLGIWAIENAMDIKTDTILVTRNTFLYQLLLGRQ